MSAFEWAQILLYFILLVLFVPLLGNYIVKVYSGEPTLFYFRLHQIEELLYRKSSINPKEEMTWIDYGKALLIFNVIGFIAVFFLQILQGYLPLNPQSFPGVNWQLAFNTAVSFVTNTNWQAYSGETTLSYLTQMLGLAVQNFLSAGTGMAVLMVLIRGLTRKNSLTVGNFWVDLVRSIVYIFLPLSIIMAIFLVSEGVVQSFSAYIEATSVENIKQIIPLGPAASQIAIKQLGTNGGGFFNANSAHPFENPTALTNFIETLAIILIPATLTYVFGIMIGSKRHGWLLFLVMFVFCLISLSISIHAEKLVNPNFEALPNLEGKETRLGVVNSVLWSVTTTDASNGSVNAMLSSLSPLAGGAALFNIMLGELVFGGVGVGLCSMIMFIFLTVFLAGLMVGRTPEYLGKKIEKREIQWVMVAVLMPGALILIGSGISCFVPDALASIENQGPHGLTEILYAFTSAAGNNGSAFAGLNANTPYFNIALGMVMIVGRVSIILPSLALGGLLASKKTSPPSIGTFSTNTLLFAILLAAVILIVGALTFFPALSLGAIVEHILMLNNRSF